MICILSISSSTGSELSLFTTFSIIYICIYICMYIYMQIHTHTFASYFYHKISFMSSIHLLTVYINMIKHQNHFKTGMWKISIVSMRVQFYPTPSNAYSPSWLRKLNCMCQILRKKIPKNHEESFKKVGDNRVNCNNTIAWN